MQSCCCSVFRAKLGGWCLEKEAEKEKELLAFAA
jgi:hypothetical protein